MVRVLGACETCVRLQFRVTSPDAPVYGLFCLFGFILFALAFVNLFCFACFLLLLLFLFFVFVFFFFLSFLGNGVGSINQKEYWGFEVELRIIISAGQSN